MEQSKHVDGFFKTEGYLEYITDVVAAIESRLKNSNGNCVILLDNPNQEVGLVENTKRASVYHHFCPTAAVYSSIPDSPISIDVEDARDYQSFQNGTEGVMGQKKLFFRRDEDQILFSQLDRIHSQYRTGNGAPRLYIGLIPYKNTTLYKQRILDSKAQVNFFLNTGELDIASKEFKKMMQTVAFMFSDRQKILIETIRSWSNTVDIYPFESIFCGVDVYTVSTLKELQQAGFSTHIHRNHTRTNGENIKRFRPTEQLIRHLTLYKKDVTNQQWQQAYLLHAIHDACSQYGSGFVYRNYSEATALDITYRLIHNPALEMKFWQTVAQEGLRSAHTAHIHQFLTPTS